MNSNDRTDTVYKTLVEMASDAILLSDERGGILFCNQRAKTLYGFNPKDPLGGMSLLDYVAPEKRSDFKNRLQKAIATAEQTETFKIVMTKTDGSSFPAEVTLSAIRCETTGDIKACALWIRDISSRAKAEEEKKSMDQQLRAVYKMEAIGQLARGIAHDLNNNLGAISGYTELIKTLENIRDEQLNNYTDKILSATQRSVEIINKLLTFARKSQLQIVSFDMNELVRDIVKLLESSFAKDIAISTELNAANAVMIGDAGQIENSIVNLAINARDAMPDGGTLLFKTGNAFVTEAVKPNRRYTMTPGYYLTVSVIDSGHGMDKETQDHLFEPFFTTKEPGKGTGLGLASVYGSIKSHNGYIDVESIPNGGSIFTVYFPVGRTQPAETPVQAESPSQPAPKQYILVIDDERSLLEMLIELLSWLGYSAAAFQDAQKAIAYYAEHHTEVDLAIIDWRMPKMDGLKCFHALRTINPLAKVLLSTGFCLDDERERLLKEGVAGILPKPFISTELSKAIVAALA